MSRGKSRIRGTSDPSHGTNAGYSAGCVCDPCRDAHRAYGREAAKRRRARKKSARNVPEVTVTEPVTVGAACASSDVELAWFYDPDTTRDQGREPHRDRLAREAKAKAVCSSCAIRQRDEWSIRGGLTARERRPFLTTAAA